MSDSSVTPWTIAHQAPLSVGFPRQEYWSGLPFTSAEILGLDWGCCPLFLGLAWVQSLGWEDPLEEEIATHSSILAWEIPWTEDSGRLQTVGSQESDMT